MRAVNGSALTCHMCPFAPLPDAIGHVVIRDDVPIERVREVVDSLRG